MKIAIAILALATSLPIISASVHRTQPTAIAQSAFEVKRVMHNPHVEIGPIEVSTEITLLETIIEVHKSKGKSPCKPTTKWTSYRGLEQGSGGVLTWETTCT